MTLNYEEIGFKSGLEIHAQLDSHKLFCKCPSELRQDAPHFKIRRELRPLAGEIGKIDPAALFEKTKRKFYWYEAYHDSTCLVELDEEPPHELNEDALEIALLVAKMLNCKVLDKIQVMRKTVVDGSNTSGFQRTALIGMDGHIKVNGKKIGITYIILEEDAGRRTAEDKESVTFRLDRLGIPMLEIVTDPDMKFPEDVKEVAAAIGAMLRSTGRMRRGIGTIRQDINISVTGHKRIEMKGVQDLKEMEKYIEKEVFRQLENVRNKANEPDHVRNALPDFTSKFLRPLPGAARMYPETDIPLISIDKKKIEALKLPESFESKEKRLKDKYDLSADLAVIMSRSDQFDIFEKFAKKFSNVKPMLIATTLNSIDSEVRKKINKDAYFTTEQFESVFEALNKDKITKESLLEVFIGLQEGKTLEDLEQKYKKMSDKEIASIIEKIKKENPGAPIGKLMGFAMSQLRGKADAQLVMKLLNAK